MRLPVGGGGYFRLYPLSWTTALLRRIHRLDRRPFCFTCIPGKSIRPAADRCPSRLSRFRHYVGLRKNEGKLDRLLARFRFGPVGDIIARPMRRPRRNVAFCGATHRASRYIRNIQRELAGSLAAARTAACNRAGRLITEDRNQ